MFFPDASRANYFPKENPLNTSMPVAVMQPFTPAFRGAAPGTPMQAAPVIERQVNEVEEQEVQSFQNIGNVKEEMASVDESRSIDHGVIDITSDTNSSISESDSDVCSSDGEEAIAVLTEPEPQPKPQDFFHVVQLQNVKTRVVRECKEKFVFERRVSINFDDVKGCYTACGRLIDDKYCMLSVETDWTNRCRVCYKDRRNPLL